MEWKGKGREVKMKDGGDDKGWGGGGEWIEIRLKRNGGKAARRRKGELRGAGGNKTIYRRVLTGTELPWAC